MSGPTKMVTTRVSIAKNIAKFRRCLYGTDVFQNRRNISLLFGLFFKSIPFDNKLIFINRVFLIIQKLYIRGTRRREFIDFDYYREYIDISQLVKQNPCLFIVNTLQ